MNKSDHEEDLRNAFRQLRAEDAQRTGNFDNTLAPRRSWRVRPVAASVSVAACLVVVAGLLGLFVITPQPPASSPLAETPDAEEIPFEELTDLIDRELTVAAVSEWRSPTSFLLAPES